MYPYHVFDLEPAGTFGMYPICYWWVSGGYIQPEPAMYSRCFCWFPGPLTPSENIWNGMKVHRWRGTFTRPPLILLSTLRGLGWLFIGIRQAMPGWCWCEVRRRPLDWVRWISDDTRFFVLAATRATRRVNMQTHWYSTSSYLPVPGNHLVKWEGVCIHGCHDNHSHQYIYRPMYTSYT